MDFRGIFDQGVVRPTEPVTLPNGTEVECHAVHAPNGSPNNADFWRSRTLDDLAREQRVPARASPSDLRGDWPTSERIDDLLDELRGSRR